MLVDLYRQQVVPSYFYYLTLQFIPRLARAALVGTLGLAAVGLALLQISRSVLSPFVRPGDEPVVEKMMRHRQRSQGTKVVAIGGGTGMSTLLRGLKEYTSNITAIVTVADDGGSSGRLRRELGVLPPGDFRHCITAMADSESLTTQLFQYRFNQGQGLDGHSFGNLYIVAMSAITGSFEKALVESSRVLAVQGRILPSTLQNVTLMGDLRSEAWGPANPVAGESKITLTDGAIERVYMEPNDAPAYPEAIKAILDADLITLGPGSLYTSVMPNLLVPDIPKAIRASRALKLYLCNVATEIGETDFYTSRDHLQALDRHVQPGLVDIVLANDKLDVDFSNAPKGVGQIVQVENLPGSVRLITADVVNEASPWRHDSRKLAQKVIDVYNQERRAGGSAATED
ncbi:MAG: YvcK family protein [Thermoflexales bacterium]|nr:YvcK family protein [Thermoflexales bacterium]